MLDDFLAVIGCFEVVAEGVHLRTVMRHEQSRVVVLRLAARRQQRVGSEAQVLTALPRLTAQADCPSYFTEVDHDVRGFAEQVFSAPIQYLVLLVVGIAGQLGAESAPLTAYRVCMA